MIPVGVRRPRQPEITPSGRRGGILKHLLIPLTLAVALLSLAWMLLLPALLAQKLEQTTGCRLDPGRLMANPVSGHLRMTDARLFGPTGLPDTDFLDIAYVETTVRPWHLRQRPLQIPRLVLDISSLHVVVGPDGRSNLDLWDESLARFSANSSPPLHIQSLELHVGRITVSDYSRGTEPRLSEYRPNYRRTYTGVTAWAPVWKDVLAAARR